MVAWALDIGSNVVRNLEGGALEEWDQDGLGNWCIREYVDFSVWRITSC